MYVCCRLKSCERKRRHIELRDGEIYLEGGGGERHIEGGGLEIDT